MEQFRSLDGKTLAEEGHDSVRMLGGVLLLACLVGAFTAGLLVGVNL